MGSWLGDVQRRYLRGSKFLIWVFFLNVLALYRLHSYWQYWQVNDHILSEEKVFFLIYIKSFNNNITFTNPRHVESTCSQHLLNSYLESFQKNVRDYLFTKFTQMLSSSCVVPSHFYSLEIGPYHSKGGSWRCQASVLLRSGFAGRKTEGRNSCGSYSGEQTQDAYLRRITVFQFVVCFILQIRIVKQLNLLACSNALITDFQAPQFWINCDLHFHLRVKYFNPLPLLFKALLYGQKDGVFFSGHLNV
jgi:hypothetical protein